jgi:hypothetical protein
VTDGTLVWTSPSIDGSDAGVYDVFGDGLSVVSGLQSTSCRRRAGARSRSTSAIDLSRKCDLAYRRLPRPLLGQFWDWRTAIRSTRRSEILCSRHPQRAQHGRHLRPNGGGLSVGGATCYDDPARSVERDRIQIIAIPLTSTQTQQEVGKGSGSALDDSKGSTSSRSNELNIVGVGPVSEDMADGKDDEMAGQLCVLGAPEAATGANCDARKAQGN